MTVGTRETRHASAVEPVIGHRRGGGIGRTNIQHTSPTPRTRWTGHTWCVLDSLVSSVTVARRSIGALHGRYCVGNATYGYKAAWTVIVGWTLKTWRAVGTVKARITNATGDVAGACGG